MKIEVWSDYVCPFCYIGKRKLEEALNSLPEITDVQIQFKSYQLDPHAPKYTGQNYYESLAAKFGSVEQVKQMTSHVGEQAQLVGLDFQFETMKPTNTYDAHRLTKYARKFNLENKITERLLQGHFLNSEDIGNIDTLVTIAVELGLEEHAVREILSDETAHSTEVDNDINEAKQFNITGVPFFVFNRKYAVSGAQPTESFIQAMKQVWDEEKAQSPFQNLTNEDAAGLCTDDNCDLPEQK